MEPVIKKLKLDFRERSYKKELLDKDDIPFADIMATMQELNKVNTYLGGHGITKKGVGHFIDKMPHKQALTIAEIGCGGGDNLFAIHAYLDKKKQPHSLTGIDIKEECIRFGQQNGDVPVAWICSDYQTVKWPSQNKPDLIFSSLFCHHFTDEELITQLRWLKDNSRLGFFINDLHRHPVAYYAIRLLTQLFSKSYLVKNDGPLSVRRAFKKREWIRLLTTAGIQGYTIKWQWAFRYLICVDKQNN